MEPGAFILSRAIIVNLLLISVLIVLPMSSGASFLNLAPINVRAASNDGGLTVNVKVKGIADVDLEELTDIAAFIVADPSEHTKKQGSFIKIQYVDLFSDKAVSTNTGTAKFVLPKGAVGVGDFFEVCIVKLEGLLASNSEMIACKKGSNSASLKPEIVTFDPSVDFTGYPPESVEQ